MNRGNYETSKRHQFDAYCKKVLRNEARDIYDARARRRKKEVLFSELSPAELAGLTASDDYFSFKQEIRACGLDFVVQDEDVFEALLRLGKTRLEIVLLSYYMSLSDREIGLALGMERANVQYHRKQALKELRNIFDEMEDEL